MSLIQQNIISELFVIKNFDCDLIGYDTKSQHW